MHKPTTIADIVEEFRMKVDMPVLNEIILRNKEIFDDPKPLEQPEMYMYYVKTTYRDVVDYYLREKRR